MLTPFGKAIRKMRIDEGMSLKSMADSLGVSSSYLSAVETGKRAVTKPLLDGISNGMNISETQKAELIRAAKISQQSVELNLAGRGEKAREVAIAFARSFEELSDSDIQKLKQLLNNDK